MRKLIAAALLVIGGCVTVVAVHASGIDRSDDPNGVATIQAADRLHEAAIYGDVTSDDIVIPEPKASHLAYAPGRANLGVITVKSVGTPIWDAAQHRVKTPVQVEKADVWAGSLPSTVWAFGGKANGMLTTYSPDVPVPHMKPGSRFLVRVATGRPILGEALPISDDGIVSLPRRVTNDVDGNGPTKVSAAKLKAKLHS